jgi:hypothetical protein
MIYVFKTSVKFKKQIQVISKELDKISEIQKWNFDLEDCDKILRIEATKLNPTKISYLLNSFGFNCIELE